MKIVVVGLGLIGGSYCKALSSYTNHDVYGSDLDDKVIKAAAECGCIINRENVTDLSSFDMIIVCLHPDPAKKFMLNCIENMKKDAILSDVCGIKGQMVFDLTEKAESRGVHYIGTHPMAGKEHFGFEFSERSLFLEANFIITPVEKTDKNSILTIEKLAREIGFKRIVHASPFDHDKIIAYTSQLAHIVSSAYVKSPTMQKELGFSAGSFKDMTRTATMNESMWTSLFIENKEQILFEIDELVKHLGEFRDAISAEDHTLLNELIRDGRILKENNIKNRTQESEGV